MGIAAIGIILFIYLGAKDFTESKSIRDYKSLQLQKRGIFISIGIIAISLFLVLFLLPQLLGSDFSLVSNRPVVLGFSLVFSFIISLSWYFYLSWLDIYEKEQARHLILTFALSCASTFLVFPISGWVAPYSFSLNGNFVNDLLYCIVNIGMIEELVKILPFLLILKLTKAVNESYDYLLYGGVCALGFAFVENTPYLRNTDLFVLNGRSMYSTVAHMFDTGIICYCLAMAKYRHQNSGWALIKGYLLAALAHGFYDFWLISEGYNYYVVTILFFLFSIHIFTIMKNNLINISEHYNDETRLHANRNKFRLFNLLLFIMFGGYVAVYILNGANGAQAFLKDSLELNTYVMVYLAVSFGSINIINGYVAPIAPGARFFLPLVNRHPNYLGLNFTMLQTDKEPLDKVKLLTDLLPMEGALTKRVVLSGNFNWYYFTPLHYDDTLTELGVQIIVRPAKFDQNMKDQKEHLVRVAFIKKEKELNKAELSTENVKVFPPMLMQYQPKQ